MRTFAAAAVALALAFTVTLGACKSDPPAKPAAAAPATAPASAPSAGATPPAPTTATANAPTASAPAPAPSPTSDEGTTIAPSPRYRPPMPQDQAAMEKQLSRMDEIIKQQQQVLDQATDPATRHKAETLLAAMHHRRDEVARRIGAPTPASRRSTRPTRRSSTSRR